MDDLNESKQLSLWDPKLAALLGIIFSPLLSSTLHSLNWIKVGNKNEAIKSASWSILTGIILFSDTIFFPEIKYSAPLILTIYILNYLAWYFFSAKKQIKKLEKNFHNGAKAKSFLLPIVIYICCILLLAYIDGSSSKYQNSKPSSEIELMEDISGVWLIEQENILTEINLRKENSFILLNKEEKIPLEILFYDLDSELIYLNSKEDNSIQISIRKVVDSDNNFYLNLSSNSGINYTLSYVRDL